VETLSYISIFFGFSVIPEVYICVPLRYSKSPNWIVPNANSLIEILYIITNVIVLWDKSVPLYINGNVKVESGGATGHEFCSLEQKVTSRYV
jgi:hypothetical protein